jgi:glycine hydroxymethyltransferase
MWTNPKTVAQTDPEIWNTILAERARQEAHIELIASENYASPAVMEAQGCVMTNKYAEGYPGKRYYGGCEHVDVAENLAIARIKQLFDCDFANVQPHSGAQANAAVFMALVSPGDTVMGMNLAQGGHLTHGNPANFSGKYYKIIPYGLDARGYIDYDEMERIAVEAKPKMLIGGFSAYSRVKDWARMRQIADKVGAVFWVDMAHIAGLVAAGEYPSPLPHAHVVSSTTHKTLRGPRGGIILSKGQSDDFNKKFNSAVFPGTQGGPLMHVIAAKAVAFKEALAPEFKAYQKQVVANARAMAEVFMKRGHKVVSGGTDNHLFLVDLVAKNVTGKDAEAALGRAHLTVNKNSVPNDPKSPFVTSGLRLGSPASTTRGFREAEMREVAGWICDVVDVMSSAGDVEAAIGKVRGQAEQLCARFPVYQAGHKGVKAA